MTKDLEIRTVPEAKTPSRRPKSVIVKTRSAENGASTSFSDDFLYVFKANVKAARKKTRERRAATRAGKPVG